MSVTQVPIELSSTPGIVDNSNTTAITIDSSENVLVGKTSTAFGTDGVEIRNDQIWSTNTSSDCLSLNRKSTNGAVATFYKDGSGVGIIGTSSGDLTIGTGDTGLYFYDAFDSIIPWNTTTNGSADSSLNLGTANNRFKDLYLSGGVDFGAASGRQSNATSASNLLDDYEEGTFTVTVNGTSGGSDTAYYTKIGNTVFWQYYTGSKTFTAVQAKITGLPFITSNASQNYALFFATHNSAVTNSNSGYSSLNSNVSYFITDNTTNSATYNGGTQYFMVSGKYTVD